MSAGIIYQQLQSDPLNWHSLELGRSISRLFLTSNSVFPNLCWAACLSQSCEFFLLVSSFLHVVLWEEPTCSPAFFQMLIVKISSGEPCQSTDVHQHVHVKATSKCPYELMTLITPLQYLYTIYSMRLKLEMKLSFSLLEWPTIQCNYLDTKVSKISQTFFFLTSPSSPQRVGCHQYLRGTPTGVHETRSPTVNPAVCSPRVSVCVHNVLSESVQLFFYGTFSLS